MEEQLIRFVARYGWQLALIALAGIVILGVLKYANVFSKIDKEKRKPIYLGISISLSIIGSAIYLLVIHNFEIMYFITVSLAIYALNQTMYSIYENTSLRDLMHKVFDTIIQKIKTKKIKDTEDKESK